jgi:hypothetical protein
MGLSNVSKMLLWGANIWFFGEGLLGPLFAVFTEKIGGNILDVSWAWSTFLIVTGVFYIIFGKIIVHNKINHSKMLVISYGLNAIFTFGYLLVKTPVELFFIQVGLGICEAIGSPLWDTLYAKSIHESHAAYAWGLAGGQSQIVTGIATLIGGFTAYYFSFEALFIAMGTVQIIATLIQARLLFVNELI